MAKLASALLVGAASLAATVARADDVDRAMGQVIHLDQRVHIMALEFNEAPREAADLPDRRLVDAQELLGLGRTNEASTLLLAIIVRWPRTFAARDATFLLGDALFQLGDFMSARRYYEKAVSAFTGSKREQRALVRLIEIALRTPDLEHVDRYLDLLATVEQAALDPAVAYAKAKVCYRRDKLDEAERIFASIAPASSYGWRARYFIGTIKVRRGDLGGATAAYEALLRTAASDEDAQQVQDLARLALARISTRQGRTERAIAYYQSLPSRSKVLGDGLYELGWTHVRSKDFDKARSSFARLLRILPDGPQAPEVKLLLANLHLRQGDLAAAQGAFSSARDELEPAYQKLRGVIVRSQADPVFLSILTTRNLDDLDLAAFVPASARRWVRADPEVERLLALAKDVVGTQKDVADATATLESIQGVLADPRRDRLALFMDLGRARQGSTAVLSALVEIRTEFTGRARRLEQPFVLEAELLLLDRNAAERASLERQLGARGAADAARGEDANVADITMPRDVPDHVGQLRAVVLQLGEPHSNPHFGIAEAQQAADPTLVSGGRARTVAERLQHLVGQEQQIQEKMLTRLLPGRRKDVDRELEVVARADAAVSQLFVLDARLDAEADARVAALQELLADRRRDVAAADRKLAIVVSEAQNVGEALARVMYTRVADRLYDVIVRADVGLIDVAWAEKDRSSVGLRTVRARKQLEQEALDKELRREQAALSRRFAAVTAWVRALQLAAPREDR